MSGNITLYSRAVFVFLLVFASVMTFIMCSDAAIANPMTTHTDNGGKHKILRSLFSPYSQHHPPAPGLPSTETGLQTGTNTEIEIGGNFREALSIIDHQSNPLQFTNSSFSYGHNTPGNRRFRAGITRMQGGYGAGGVRPTSSLFTSHSQHGGQSFERAQSRLNYHPLSQEVAQAGNSYPLIVRKSSKKEAGSPFQYSSSFLQVWEPRGVQKTYKEAKVPRNYPPKLATDKTAWPLQTAEYWSTSLPTPRGHYSGYKETNELSAVRASGIQSSKFFGFASQAASHAPSISKGSDTSVIKHNPGREKVASSITDFSQGLRSSSETLRHKNVKSYLFKDSQPSFETDNTVTSGGQKASSRLSTNKQRSSDAQVYSRFPSNSKQLHSKDPIKEDNTTPLYPHTSVAQYGGQTHSFTKYQQVFPSIYPPTQLSSHRVSGRHSTMESFIPLPNAASQDNYVTSEKSVVGSRVNTATSESLYGYKPGQSAKSIYGIRGFKNPLWPAVKKPSVPSSSERTNSQQYSFDKGKDYKFKIANVHPPLSPKYSFGQRGASTLTTTPAKLERTPKQYLPPSPGSLDLIQSTTVSTPRLFTSGFMDVHPPLPESDAGMDSNPHHRQLRIYKRIYGLKGFGTRPLEGAKALVSEPDKSATHQQGFEPRSSQIWQLKSSRIHRRYNQTDEREPETSNISTPRQNELSSEGFKPLLKTAGSTESVESSIFSPDKYKKNRKIYTFLGFQPIRNRIANAHQKTHWKYPEQNPTTAPPKHRVSSAHLRSAGGLKVESSPTSEPRTPSRTKPAAMKASLLSSSTSSTVRGKRVRGKYIKTKKLNESTSLTNDTVNVAIVRLPKLPARFKAVTYADILGSASFSSVRATTQTPVTPADMDYLPNTTAVTKQREGVAYWTLNSDDGVHSRENTSRGPETNAEDEVEDFSSVEEKKLGFKSRGLDSGMKTFDALLDNEGSGSGGFNLSDVKSTEELSEDLSELDYLQMSTGNISFKSVKLSQTEK